MTKPVQPQRLIEYIDDDVDDRTDQEKSFDEFITGLGAERTGVLRVGKLKTAKDGVPLANTRSAHCFACPIDQYTYDELLEYLRDHFGSGLYRVLGIPAGERVKFNKIVEVAADMKPKEIPTSSTDAQNPLGVMETVARMMAESQKRTEELIARLTITRTPSVDPTESFMKMAGLFSTMMQSMAPMFKPAQPSGDFMGELEKFAKIKEVLSGLTGDGGNGNSESNFYDVVKTGLQSFGPLLTQVVASKTAAASTEMQALPPAGMSSVNYNPASYQKPTPAVRGADSAMSNFKRQVDTLVANAKAGVDPMQLAGTILDLTPDEKLDDLATMLEAPDVIEKMAALNPEVQNHRPFFDALRRNILGLLPVDEPDTVPLGNTAGEIENGAATS